MRFTRSDLETFAIGLGVALAVTLGEALIAADSVADAATWARNLGIGLTTSAGRYLLTYLGQRGLGGSN